jgi:outer membrane protein TolC
VKAFLFKILPGAAGALGRSRVRPERCSQGRRWLRHLTFLLSATVVACAYSFGQQSSSSTAPTAQQVPPSGRSQSSNGSVQAQQSSSSTGSSSVDTVSSSIQVTGAYQGSVPDPNAPRGLLALTIADAIQRGLRFNLGSISANSSVIQLRGERLSALSKLLPDIYATVSETGEKLDLQTLGLTTGVLGPTPLPTTISPFHYYSALANVDEEVSMTSVYNLRQSKASADAAEMSARDARELVVLAVGGTYLNVLAAKANVVSEEAQVKQAEATFKLSDDQYRAGTIAVIDRNRNFVEFHTEQQRLSSLRGDLMKQTMQLARLIGLPVYQQLALSEQLQPQVASALPVDEALKAAIDTRPDLLSARLQLQAAQDALRASKSEYLPSLSVSGNYGLDGVNPNKGASVFQASASIRIPIFEGGRVRADVTQADSAVTQRQAEYADEKGVVELQIREAYVDLQVASDQIATATDNRNVAAETLTQSLDRFGAGVTNSVEVVQSEETVASAERDYVSSLLTLNLARISVARASGQAEQFIPNMLKGN